MDTQLIPDQYTHIAPDGSEIREIMENQHGGIAHITLKAGQITKAIKHKTVSEFWHVLTGKGQLWRRLGHHEEITILQPGITIDIARDCEFQFRCDEGELTMLCITMPPWPGREECVIADHEQWQSSC